VSHTSGPWEIDQVDLSSWHILGPTNGFCADVLATINDTDTPQGEANARLIAAAPEMLAGLIEAAERFRLYETLHRQKGTEDGERKAQGNAGIAAHLEGIISKATDVQGGGR